MLEHVTRLLVENADIANHRVYKSWSNRCGFTQFLRFSHPMTRESQPSVDKTWRMVAEPLQDYCANLGMSYRVRLRIFLALVSTPRD